MPTSPARRSPARSAAAALVALGALLVSGEASAALCSSLPNPVYLTGSGKVVVADLAKTLSVSGITLVYKLQGSCLAIDAVLNGTKIGTPTDTKAAYWDSVNELSCDLDPAGDVADLALSDVFPSTCFSLPNGLPTNVGDFFGPVEAYTFVTPKASTQKSISKEAAYFVFGFGNDSGVAPWTDETSLFVRGPTSGTQQMFAAAIGVPSTNWKGVIAASSADVVTKVSMSANPEATIGILTAEVSGASRSTLNVLAYQDGGQTCGYWPDSTPTSFDKRNVRDGHYPIWGPLHLLSKLDVNGYPLNKTAGDVIGYLTGTKAPPGSFDLIALLGGANIIPQCAMRVRRTAELGPLQSFAPPGACGCYFEAVATGSSDCKTCSTDTDCTSAAPKCSYGYCETQ
jgi:hypothetical protein